MVCANLALAPVHASRGYLAGTGQFGRTVRNWRSTAVCGPWSRWALLLLACPLAGPVRLDSCRRAVIGGLGDGVGDARPTAARGSRRSAGTAHCRPRPSYGIGLMLIGALASQLLINAGPVVVKLLAAPGDDTAGHFRTHRFGPRTPLSVLCVAGIAVASISDVVQHPSRGGGSSGRTPATGHAADCRSGHHGDLGVVRSGPDWPSVRAELPIRAIGLGARSIGCTVYVLAGLVAQVLLARHKSGTVAVGWWLGVAGFAATLPISTPTLPIRVSLALIVGAAAAGIWFAVLSRHDLVRPRSAGAPVTGSRCAQLHRDQQRHTVTSMGTRRFRMRLS